MYTYYIKRSFSVLSIFVLMAITGMGIFSQPAHAQEIPTTNFCPIDGAALITVLNQDLERVFGDKLSDTVKVKNPTKYTLGAVRVGVAIYANEDDVIPSYWTVLPDTYVLTPEQEIEISTDIEITTLPRGSYYYRYFVGQGDEKDLLGIAIRDIVAGPLKFEKNTERSDDITLSVDTKTVIADAEPINATITVKNGETPLQGAVIIATVTQGEIPLGSAVRATVMDEVKMVPRAVREVTIADNFTESGIYTLYTWLQKDSAVQPLMRIVIGVGDEAATQTNVYLSHIGLSSYPLEVGSIVVACLDYLGTTELQVFPSEIIGINFFITDLVGNEIVKNTITTEATQTSDFLSFSVSEPILDFNLTVELLEERFKSVAQGESESGTEVVGESSLIPVASLLLSFSCDDLGLCPSETGLQTEEYSIQQSIWFYVGVIISALLLAGLMIGRLRSAKPKEDFEMTKPQI